MFYDLVSCPITYDLCSRYHPKLSNNLSIDEAWVDGFTRLYVFIKASAVCWRVALFAFVWKILAVAASCDSE